MNTSIVSLIIEKQLTIWKKKTLSLISKNDYTNGSKIERTMEIIATFSNKNSEELNKLYLKSDVILLTHSSENFLKVSV